MSLILPTAEQAERFMRTVEPSQEIGVAFLTPRRGQKMMTLSSLPAVEDFLDGRSFEAHRSLGFKSEIHYTDLRMLAVWLEEIIGDHELADSVSDVISDGRSFGELSGDVKALLTERVDQCCEVLGLTGETEVSPEVAVVGGGA